MIITKQQSKRLRYICGAVDYNQPCDRKYTGGPEGKIRQIGKFKYIENGGELKSLTFDGGAVNLDGITFDVLLSCIMKGDGLGPIQAAALSEPKKPSDIEDAVALTPFEPDITVHPDPLSEPKKPSDIEDAAVPTPVEPAVVVHLDVARGNDVHAVNVPVMVEAEQQTDDWCTPDNVDRWEEPDELEKIQQAETPKKLEDESEKETPPYDYDSVVAKCADDLEKEFGGPRTIKEPTAEGYPEVTREEFENALRETAMNAAAREALRILNLECGFDDAATILRAMAKVPNFIVTYGKCLEQVGTPHSLEEIAVTLPDQEKWLRSLAINDWKIKD